MEALAPPSSAETWDRIGLQVGNPDASVDGVLTALGLTNNVLDEALRRCCNMVLVHHPVIFEPLTALREDEGVGRLVVRVVRENLSVYVAHTNIDNAPCGLNFWLASRLGLQSSQVLASKDPQVGTGRVGELPEAMELNQFCGWVKRRLNLPGLRYVQADRANPTIRRVAVVGGSGASFMYRARRGWGGCFCHG